MATDALAASGEAGKRVPTSCKVTQASDVWPSVPRDWPSFRSASPAFGPEGCLIIHWLAAVAPRTYVFNLDTGYQFRETLELRDKLFDLFSSTKPREGGVGLWLAKTILLSHEASISLDTEYSQGTRFVMVFPKVHQRP